MPKKKRRQLSAKDIKVKKTAMPRRLVSHSREGRKHRMVFSRFVQNLFRLNCTLPPSKKMTDGEIARQVYLEYSHHEVLAKRFSDKNPRLSIVISKSRSEYNRGKLIPSEGPPKPEETSFAYNERGEAVNSRFNIPKPWTPDEIRKFKALTKERRDKFLEENPQVK